MAEIIIFICLLLIITVLAGRLYHLRKEINSFTDQLENALDQLIEDQALAPAPGCRDTVQDKIFEKIYQAGRIWMQKNNENLKEKEKIKELISDISHQTKTPIANMKLYLEMLKDADLPDGSKEYIALQSARAQESRRRDSLFHLENQTEKLDFLLQSMVKISRLETGIIEIHRQKSPLCETISQAVSAVVPKAAKKNLSLFVQCDENILLNYDKKWTEEALFNILDNAVKYTETGSINIHVSVQEFFTKISIRDTGKGIAPERQAQIFTRFYREPEVYEQEGIGIGLYLARQILALQNGYIEVHSELGKGSDFQLYLPNENW